MSIGFDFEAEHSSGKTEAERESGEHRGVYFSRRLDDEGGGEQ